LTSETKNKGTICVFRGNDMGAEINVKGCEIIIIIIIIIIIGRRVLVSLGRRVACQCLGKAHKTCTLSLTV
jgi:hypothetical protein